MSSLAKSVVEPAKMVNRLANALLKDIKPEQFARVPKGVKTNSPAWVFGHLAIYPDRALLPLIGKAHLAQPSDDFNALFADKTECKDDPNGTIYPSMEAITTRYFKRTDVLLATIAEMTDAELSKAIPKDHFFADKMTHLAGGLNFMLCAHTMMHFGQVSAWRRIMGLGSAM